MCKGEGGPTYSPVEGPGAADDVPGRDKESQTFFGFFSRATAPFYVIFFYFLSNNFNNI